MKKNSYCLLWAFLILGLLNGQSQEYELSFTILDNLLAEPLDNVSISISPCQCGGVSNVYGEFSIDLPRNNYRIKVTHIGFNSYEQAIVLDKDVSLEIVLVESQEKLSEVIVLAKKNSDYVESPQMGVLQLGSQELKKIPAAIGEVDVLRGMTLLPGVNNSGEISNGLSVRGGSLDQNLLLFEYAPVFNPTHLFGLFSVFTPEVLSSVDLYRANIPSRYGGRATSVVDVKVKNPYTNKFKLTGGIGLVSSRIAIETPIIKDKLMLIAGGRAGLTDFLLPIFSERLKNTKARFYDSTVKLMYLPTEKDQISLTGFFSKDFYQLDLITQIENINAENNQYDFQTLNGTLNWLHTFDESTSLKTILVGGNYTPKNFFPETNGDNEIKYESSIEYTSLISEFLKKASDRLDYYLGVQANRYKINPGELDPGTSDGVLPVSLSSETSYEFSAYTNFNWKPLNDLTFSGGLRFNHFIFQGPYTLNTYDDSGNTIDTEFFEKGEKVQSYSNLEPRMGVSLVLNKNMSIKASYANVNQYLQNIYNSTTPIPTSRWKTADPYIKPQISHSFGLGVYKSLQDDIEIGLEGYYRDTQNNLTYKPGARFFLEEAIEQDVVQVLGKAYGVELSIKKPKGKVNGWFNYTWSRSLLRSENEGLTTSINQNQWFNSDFDRPHVINATLNLEGNKYNTFSFNFTGQTGRPYTIANGVFELEDLEVPIFLERNNSRLPMYHRLDFSWNVHFSASKEKKRWTNDWTFTVYNVYGRKNPFSTYYGQRDGATNGEFFGGLPLGSYQLFVSNSPIVALTYNFTFQ
ncbi:MAG: TonB-dependent receptor [Flavobacteriaceae bacterium]